MPFVTFRICLYVIKGHADVSLNACNFFICPSGVNTYGQIGRVAWQILRTFPLLKKEGRFVIGEGMRTVR